MKTTKSVSKTAPKSAATKSLAKRKAAAEAQWTRVFGEGFATRAPAAPATRPDGSVGLTAEEARQLRGLRAVVRQLNADLDAAYKAGAPGAKIESLRAAIVEAEGEVKSFEQILDASGPAEGPAPVTVQEFAQLTAAPTARKEDELAQLGRLANELIAAANDALPGARWDLADLEVSLRFLSVSKRLCWIASLGRTGADGSTAIEALTALCDHFKVSALTPPTQVKGAV